MTPEATFRRNLYKSLRSDLIKPVEFLKSADDWTDKTTDAKTEPDDDGPATVTEPHQDENAGQNAENAEAGDTTKGDEPEPEPDDDDPDAPTTKTGDDDEGCACHSEKPKACQCEFADTRELLQPLQSLLALLQAQAILFQTASWQFLGSDAQPELDDARGQAANDADDLGEKVAAYYGPDAVDLLTICPTMWAWLLKWHGKNPMASEDDLQQAIAKVRSAGEITNGLEDYLNELAKRHDTVRHTLTLGDVRDDTANASAP